MKANRKVTVHLPAGLLEDAQRLTGKGITETIREGLEAVRRRKAYDGIRGLRGKLKLDLDLDEMRRDRL